ncbi:putative polyphosphate nucleotide phosphotransferase PPK [Variovorax paradoxus B4]|uniref:Polyphosphate kinase 2 (PPK2) n=2 Tax=Variovorax paradoxus TaxID=34073 RepID=A0A0H2MPR3_VARPD|nr:PPK2 family polyphosphate kinase [Variovorax paradoxus]AGU50168.1 putative polyphosphate nucleotide phosphotransferase PPK [Variovorax paradoxus B4]KLN58690.1 polyphosphate kinase 2 (PPK2) [Variovorax paradoxus]
MASFKKYRVDSNFRLSQVHPGESPFLEGDEAAQVAEIDALAIELDEMQDLLHAEGRRKVLLVLQGMDSSGKDGTIRWVFSRTSPMGVRVTAFKAPSDDERAHDYLWRCHAVVPRSGEIAVWNRSHYEDVLVPVVEGWIDKAETRRRYAQINDFERLLIETGTVIVKCMLHIGKDEQRERLQARIDTPGKQWKFDLGDLEVRTKWNAYQQAYGKALRATSTEHAPWYVIPADNKRHRNLMIARLLMKTLRQMKLKVPPADPALKGMVVK